MQPSLEQYPGEFLDPRVPVWHRDNYTNTAFDETRMWHRRRLMRQPYKQPVWRPPKDWQKFYCANPFPNPNRAEDLLVKTSKGMLGFSGIKEQ